MEYSYIQSPQGEAIDKLILDWYANMDEDEMELWTLYAAHIYNEMKRRGAKHFGLQSALLLVARYELGLI